MKIQAAVTHAQGADFAIEEVTLSGPKANEVLVRIVATGVCHTDAVGVPFHPQKERVERMERRRSSGYRSG